LRFASGKKHNRRRQRSGRATALRNNQQPMVEHETFASAVALREVGIVMSLAKPPVTGTQSMKERLNATPLPCRI
jgi:hypothetical protein